jgi:hypothetical protein
MRWVRMIPLAMLLAPMGVSADTSAESRTLPPVLRNQDPPADVIVLLPGSPQTVPQEPAAPAVQTAKAVPPGPVSSAPELSTLAPPAPFEDPGRPILRHIYPPSFEADSAVFCQKLIGQWTVSDARFLLGEPLRQRPAYDDRQAVNGRIYAFADPTKRYKELELDFEAPGGALRTVFAYPWDLTWHACRRIWGVQVNEAEAPRGRKFYSYLDRRLDVLVDPAGKVISLGLY